MPLSAKKSLYTYTFIHEFLFKSSRLVFFLFEINIRRDHPRKMKWAATIGTFNLNENFIWKQSENDNNELIGPRAVHQILPILLQNWKRASCTNIWAGYDKTNKITGASSEDSASTQPDQSRLCLPEEGVGLRWALMWFFFFFFFFCCCCCAPAHMVDVEWKWWILNPHLPSGLRPSLSNGRVYFQF